MHQIKSTFKLFNLYYLSIAIFLIGNIVSRFEAGYWDSTAIKTIYWICICFSAIIVLLSQYLNSFLFIVGLSFMMFGFHSWSSYNQVFEFLLSTIALGLLLINVRKGYFNKKNTQFILILILFISLSISSLLLLPIKNVLLTFWFWDFFDFFNTILNAAPSSYLYSFAAINRMILFFLFVFLLSNINNCKSAYHSIFTGILFGTLFSTILGILDYYAIFSLDKYRQLDPIVNPKGALVRLQSTFGHPGWFAEFVTITIPFILIGFFRKQNRMAFTIFLFSTLIVCEIALILAKARAGWISYPVTLLFCWIFFHLYREDKQSSRWIISRKNLIKVLVSVPITIIVSILAIQILFGQSNIYIKKISESNTSGKNMHSIVEREKLINRAASLFKAQDRTYLWKQGLFIGAEQPVIGLGYESYGWHMLILEKLQNSIISKYRERKVNLDTPHNLYLQIFVGCGIVGIYIWMVLVTFAIFLLIGDLVENKNYFNICLLLSMISFHIYGIFQSMQYISVIWFLIFLIFGYVMTIDKLILLEKHRTIWNILTIIGILVTSASAFAYVSNMEMRKLADKYGINTYSKYQDSDRFIGFYDVEKYDNKTFRWSGRKGLIRFSGNGLIELNCHLSHPKIDENPVLLSIYLDGEIVDQLTVLQLGSIVRHYYINDNERKYHEIVIEVSRTWNPKKLGLSQDNRGLGVAVAPIKFMKTMPTDGVGFYNWELWGGDRLLAWPKDKPINFRWTGNRAFLNLQNKYEKGCWIYLKCSHPNIQQTPVHLTIDGNGRKIQELTIRDANFRVVKLDSKTLKGLKVLTIHVSRTWNPKLAGISDDGRDLGVAVAVLAKD